MRRVLVAVSALGLASALVSAPVPVAGQGATITLSLVDASNTSTTVTAIGEDGGAQTLQVKAVASAAPATDVSVTVTVGAAGGTATVGASNDYTRNKSSVTVTIGAAALQGISASVTITPVSDTITEQHETIRFTGTATGYTIAPVDLAITDQDRVIQLTAEGDETTPKKTALTRIENHHHQDFWIYVHGALGGVTNDVFTASTGNTYGSTLNLVVKYHEGTANGIDGSDPGSSDDWASDHHTLNTSNRARISIPDGTLGADAFDQGNKNLNIRIANDNKAEGDEVFYIGLKDNPAGFTHRRVPVTILDDDTQVEVVVDTDSGEDGNQAVLTEGDSGSGVSVSGRFAGKWREPNTGGTPGSHRGVGSSVLGSATVVTLSAAGAATPSAGQAGTGDLTYSASPANTVTIPTQKVSSTTAGSLAGLTVTDDTVVEGAETFTVTGSSSFGDATAATLTIADDDADIALSVDTARVREGDGATTVTVTARFAGQSSVLTSATDVAVTVGAGATNGATPDTDFTTGGSGVSGNGFTVSIPARQLTGSKSFTLTPTADNSDEGTEKIAVTGTASVGRAVTVTSAEIDLDDPHIPVALSFHQAVAGDPALSGVSESGGAQTVRVKATAGSAVSSATTVTVTVGAAGGTAALGSSGDYTRSAATVSVTIPNGGTESDTADVTITPRDDGVAEGPETIRFSGTGNDLAVTDADLEIRETIELVLSATAVGEGDGDAGAVTATARFAGATSSVLTGATDVVLSFAAGANADTQDFTAPGSAVTLSIPAGSTESSATALSGLGIMQDMRAEGAESIAVGGSVTGFAVSGAVLGITDDDLDVVLTADTDIGTNGEQKDLSEGGTVAVRVRAALGSGVTNDLTSGLVVSVTAGEASPASATEGSGGDFTAPASPVAVTIPTGSNTDSGWTNLTGLAVSDDAITEGAETFLITGTVPGGTVTADTLTIGASDDVLDVSVSPQTVAEQSDAHTITVTVGFRGASGSELTAATTVNVAVASGDSNGATLATSCPDTSTDACTNTDTFNISIPAGQATADGTFSVTARDDGDAESTETLKITGTEAGDSTNTDSATLNIVDASSGIQVELLNPADDSDLTSLGEDSGASQVKVKVTMPGAVAAETVVGLNIGGGSAAEDTNNAWTAREDYRISGLTAPTGTPSNHELGVVVAANETEGEATFTITVQDDNADEEDEETIQITGDPVNSLAVLGATLKIADNDDAPNVVLALQTPGGGALASVQENESPNTTVQVRAAYQGGTVSDKTVSIPITVGKAGETGEAAAGTDYQTVGVFNIVIDQYETTGTQTFQLIIDTEDDTDAEGPETVTVTGDDTDLPIGTIGEAQLTIIDDDAAITLAFLNASDEPLASLEEGTGTTTVKIRASYPSGKSLPDAQTIPLTPGGTASAADYQATSFPSQITIPATQNSATAAFTLDLSGPRDDNIDEPDETLLVTGALAGFIVNPGALEIVDNDGPPTGIALTISPDTAAENRGTSPLRVTVTAALVGNRSSQPTPVRVTVGAAGSTATRDSDYRNQGSSSLTITIPAEASSATGNFRVVILSDTLTEQTERIRIAADSAYGRANADFRITNVSTADPGGGGGGGGGAPPPSGGGGGGGGGAPPPAGPPPGPVTPPPAEPVCQGRFCDEDGNVHQANIEQIAAWEITLGCDADDATKFCPSAQITRRQMAAFLHRAVNRISPITPPTGIEINDVPTDAWYRAFADWVVSTGAFAAPDGQFNPGGVVTRADMAVMMIASFPDINAVDEPEGLFNDVAGATPEVVRAVEGMYHTGVTRGCSAEPLNYCPDQPVTRAQMASFFVRAVNYTPPAADS